MVEERPQGPSAPDGVAETVARLGRNLVVQLYAVSSLAQAHGVDGKPVLDMIGRFQDDLRQLLSLAREVELVCRPSGGFLVNDHLVTPGAKAVVVFAGLARQFKQRQVGSITFVRVPTTEEMCQFVRAWMEASETGPWQELQGVLWRQKVSCIALAGVYDEAQIKGLELLEVDIRVRQAYFRAIYGIERLTAQAAAGNPIQTRLAKRVVQTLVDVLERRDSGADYLLLLTELRNWMSYRSHHSVNVCVLSIGFGLELGLSRIGLRQVGLAALLHDIGYVRLPASLSDASQLETSEWEIVKQHSVAALPLVGQLQELDPDVVKATMAVLSHHWGYQGGGYPEVKAGKPGLMAQIIAIADRYDAMTSSRPYRAVPMKPAEGMAQLVKDAGKTLNPLLVKRFLHWLGPFPIGSLVMLDTGEVALVVGKNPEAKDRPSVRVLSSVFGVKSTETIALEEMSDQGKFKRTIIQLLDAFDAGVSAKLMAVLLQS